MPTHDNVPRGNIMNDTTLGIEPTPAKDDSRVGGDVGKIGLGGANGPGLVSVALLSASNATKTVVQRFNNGCKYC